MTSQDSNRLTLTQINRNRLTRTDWETFASHRAQVTDLLIEASDSKPTPSICILGAGNGNDLDLSRLLDRYASVTLVDLDQEALDHCLASQSARHASRITAIGGMDVSGLLNRLGQLGELPASDPRWLDAIERARSHSLLDALGQFDVIASTCLLTQMIDSVASAVGPQHHHFSALTTALRDGHVRLLCELTRSVGSAVLITDIVSSDTLPELGSVEIPMLTLLLSKAINDRNFFTGTNPAVIAQKFAASAGSTGANVRMARPWRWKMGSRAYGVCAIAMIRPA